MAIEKTGKGFAAPIKSWTTGRLSARLHRTIASIAASEDVVYVAVMPDIHEGPHVPNGCVIATRNLVYPETVGQDIGCGVSAIQCDGLSDRIPEKTLESFLSELEHSVPSIKHSSLRAIAELPDACRPNELSDRRLAKFAKREGMLQLGTLGRGNHFVELQRDETEMLWIMVHSGSRGMGKAVTDLHLGRAQRSKTSGLLALDLSQDAGQAYVNDMGWAMRYASENRLHIINRVADLLEHRLGAGVIAATYIDCPHNFAAVEEHFDERWIVHRKSANRARHGELGIIPGSMASGSRIVSGRGNAASLHSSAHGAGRAMSRREAMERIDYRNVSRMMRGITYQIDRTEKLRDEAPAAYKDLNEVMKNQCELVRTEKTLTTVLNYKGF